MKYNVIDVYDDINDLELKKIINKKLYEIIDFMYLS